MIDRRFFDRLRSLQSFIKERGLGSSQLTLPAPRLLLLPDPSSVDAKEEVLFAQFVTEEEIVSVCKDLFESGFYSQAVEESFKALDKLIKSASGNNMLSGVKLVNEVFSPNDPVLCWSDRSTISEIDEHKGYHQIFAGVFLGIRNPTSHEIGWISDHTQALDAILIAQHLVRKTKKAIKTRQA